MIDREAIRYKRDLSVQHLYVSHYLWLSCKNCDLYSEKYSSLNMHFRIDFINHWHTTLMLVFVCRNVFGWSLSVFSAICSFLDFIFSSSISVTFIVCFWPLDAMKCSYKCQLRTMFTNAIKYGSMIAALFSMCMPPPFILPVSFCTSLPFGPSAYLFQHDLSLAWNHGTF